MRTASLRLPDPLVASIIFAPVARNQSLSSVTASSGLAEALTFEWMMEQDDESIGRIFRSRWRDVEEVKRFVSALCGQLEVNATPGFAALATVGAAVQGPVPRRSFPFAAHFDLLALPVVEGISFDVDDFVEH